MNFAAWDTLFNVLILLFWFRIWSPSDRMVFFNPYLAPVQRVSDTALGYIRPAFRWLGPRALAALLVVFLIALRGLAVPSQARWVVTLGFDSRGPATDNVLACMAFSLLSFAAFLFRLSAVAVLYVWTGRGMTLDRTKGALYQLAQPFMSVRPNLRPAVLVGICTLLGWLMAVLGNPAPPSAMAPWQVATGVPSIFAFVVSALAAWVDVLLLIHSAMILLIIGSLVSIFTGAHGLMGFCREWIDLLLGPIRRYPLRIGMFDLSPFIFLMGIQFVQAVLKGLLVQGYLALT